MTEYERWPGVGINWAVFGLSGHRTKPEGPVIENFVRCTEAVGYNRQYPSAGPTCAAYRISAWRNFSSSGGISAWSWTRTISR